MLSCGVSRLIARFLDAKGFGGLGFRVSVRGSDPASVQARIAKAFLRVAACSLSAGLGPQGFRP